MRKPLKLSHFGLVLAIVLSGVSCTEQASSPQSSPTPRTTVSQRSATPAPAISPTVDIAQIEKDFEHADGPERMTELGPRPEFTDELIARGEFIYISNCSSCHGSKGIPEPVDSHKWEFDLDLTDASQYKYGSTPEDIAYVSTFGIEDTGMAPWGDILEPEEVWAIAAYIDREFLKRPPSPVQED